MGPTKDPDVSKPSGVYVIRRAFSQCSRRIKDSSYGLSVIKNVLPWFGLGSIPASFAEDLHKTSHEVFEAQMS